VSYHEGRKITDQDLRLRAQMRPITLDGRGFENDGSHVGAMLRRGFIFQHALNTVIFNFNHKSLFVESPFPRPVRDAALFSADNP
ncbi:MAG: hypothetical protein WAV38_23465, partial [Xanthobacteraceae bacterium]